MMRCVIESMCVIRYRHNQGSLACTPQEILPHVGVKVMSVRVIGYGVCALSVAESPGCIRVCDGV